MKYEYKVVNINVHFNLGSGIRDKLQEVCDDLGSQGWEMVNFQCYDISSKILVVFKRKKEEF